MDYKQFFLENTNTDLFFNISLSGYHHNQHDLILTAKNKSGNIIGKIEYSEYQGKPFIRWIEVDPDYRRLGVGKQLINYLQKQYPNEEIEIGGTTELGTKFFDKLPKQYEPNQRYAKLKNRLDSLKKAEEKLTRYVNRTKITNDRITNLFNNINDEMWNIENELRNLSPGKTKFIETFVKEDYPLNWNIETFKSLKSFSKRIAYCNQNLQKIASGSSRIVYKIDNDKVLKLARNNKGIAQNSVERDWFIQQSYSDIAAKVFDTDENDLWLEMEFVKKVTPSRFKSIVGESIEVVGRYLIMLDGLNNGRPVHFLMSSSDVDRLKQNEWIDRVYSLCADVSLSVGDFGKISSYGEVVREGKPAIVIVDMGLSKSVYTDFYSVN